MNDLELNVESLEQRRMMAGDVSVRVTGGGDLRIDGDRLGNEVVVRPTDQADRFVVQGLNGTTVNGSASLDVSGVTDDIRINLRGGDNALMLPQTDVNGTYTPFHVPDDLTIRTGSGSDAIVGELKSAGDDVQIRTSGGRDAVLLHVETADRVAINTGSSGDIVSLGLMGFSEDASGVGAARLQTGAGDDTAWLSLNSIDSPVEVDLGSGNDIALSTLRNEFFGGLNVQGGSGHDEYFDMNEDSYWFTQYGPDPGDTPTLVSVEEFTSLRFGQMSDLLDQQQDQYAAYDTVVELLNLR